MAWRARDSVRFFWRRVLAVGSSAWALAICLAAFAAGVPGRGSVMYAGTFVVYAWGAVVCHQRPERSFHLWGSQLPVCARCTGLYVGAAVSAWLAVWRPKSVGQGWTARRARLLVLAAVTPTMLTLIVEWVTTLAPSNGLRAAAGFPLGAAAAWVMASLDARRSSVEVQ